MQIYASLVNISQGSRGVLSDGEEEEVFLNDFQDEKIEDEKEEVEDKDFGDIKIGKEIKDFI